MGCPAWKRGLLDEVGEIIVLVFLAMIELGH
jgi:hypothetical protein